MEREGKKFILKKISVNTWSGIDRFKDTKEGIACCIDNQGLPVTGLTEDTKGPNGKGQIEVKEGTRTIIEKELGMEPGTLKRGTSYTPNPFWVQYCVDIKSAETKFDTTNPEDFLAVEFLKAQRHVAFGNNNLKADSIYLLYSPEEAAVVANKSNKGRRDANKLFESLSLQDRKEVLDMFGVRTESLSVDEIENKLYDKMEEYPTKFTMFVNEPTRKQQAFIRTCLDRGILTKVNGDVMYNDTLLSYDVPNAALALFSEPFAATLKAIKLQINPAVKAETKE